jgi:hypothetical protein
MTDRDPLRRSDPSGRKPQIATLASLSGWPRPSEAVRGLPHATTRRMIGAWRPANGESRLTLTRRLVGTALLLAAAGLAVPILAQAQDLGNSRRVQSTVEITTFEVGDVSGHVVGVVNFKGLTFFADGETATHVNPATFDLVNGSGPHQGYVVHYFDDGATSVERYRGEARLSADGKRTAIEGTFECAGGTGRFAGLKGSGSYRGERLGALQTGDYVYVDTTGSCTAP